jgi:hypothetical protein
VYSVLHVLSQLQSPHLFQQLRVGGPTRGAHRRRIRFPSFLCGGLNWRAAVLCQNPPAAPLGSAVAIIASHQMGGYVVQGSPRVKHMSINSVNPFWLERGHASFAVQRDRNALGPRAPLVFLLLHLVFLSTEFSNNSRDVLHSYNGAVPVFARLSAQIISCA